MTTPTAVLNADGSIDYAEFAPEGQLIQTHVTSTMVKSLESMIAGWVTTNMNQPALTPDMVIIANLAVADGLITSTQLANWATSQNIIVKDIFTGNGTPTPTTPTTSQSFVSAMNDPALTTAANAPTATQAQTTATLNQLQSASPTVPGPTPIPGHDVQADQVQGAYIAFYGRPADVAGQSYWMDQLQKSGGNLDAIINSFGNSAESKALYGASSVDQQVSNVYHQLFNRAADTGGLNYWVDQINTGKVSLAGAAMAIFNGSVGSDKAQINNKMVVASAFTDSLAHNSLANSLYTGETAAANARSYLFATNTDTTLAGKLAGISDAVALHIQSGIDADLAGVGITLTGMITTHV
ncbi:DUF4214 domain-containing protein [Gulbenkiania mobilis]|uniref:Uncharacterized protein DUF4214 n=1 Tax=Gulbenkiania mobilis TaxID=397457 RepID=A0ABY2CYM4_GULMO|nr:uncharacterized protein DUF4214 [Gulbenkiania mobilis]